MSLSTLSRTPLMHMPDGGTVQISSGSYQAENSEYAEIKIKDTGIGMSNEVKQKVFDPFFSTKGPKGTGLGMSVAYGIVARHHGNIALESELGQGTTCLSVLPGRNAGGTSQPHEERSHGDEEDSNSGH